MRRGYFEILTSARALENTAFLAYVNLAGVEDGLQFWGGSRLVCPTGDVVAKAKYDEEDFAGYGWIGGPKPVGAGIGCRTQGVTGEHAKATGVGGHTGVDRNFHREVRHHAGDGKGFVRKWLG